MQGPAGGPQGAVAGDAHCAALPRILHDATHWEDDRETSECGTTCGQAGDNRAAAEGGGLPGVVQEGHEGAAIDLVRRAVVAGLNGDLLRDEALGVCRNTHAQQGDGQTRGDTQQRGVEGVPPQALFIHVLVLPRPEEVDGNECQAEDDGEDQVGGNPTGGTLLSRIVLDREAFLAVSDGHAVQFGAEAGEVFLAHLCQLGISVLILQFAHDRVPIHIAKAIITMMPPNHISMPSLTGPRPPRP